MIKALSEMSDAELATKLAYWTAQMGDTQLHMEGRLLAESLANQYDAELSRRADSEPLILIHAPQPPQARAGLFQLGNFALHSGEKSSWKIDCDVLAEDDLAALAAIAVEKIGCLIGNVEGVPTGGLRFAKAISKYSGVDGRLIIVDDVLTTGASMEAQRNGRDAVGVVIFARGKCPDWVTPIFSAQARAAMPSEVELRAIWNAEREKFCATRNIREMLDYETIALAAMSSLAKRINP